MPLTHVCMWDGDKGYRRVDIEEACIAHPYGASASSKCFICSLCGQAVTLTTPGYNVQHFRHTSAEQNKDCDDRAETYSKIEIGYSCHPMPIRLTVNKKSYQLELGFFKLPLSEEKDWCKKITITGTESKSFTYSFERISSEGITYLNVGDIPCSAYKLYYDSPLPDLNNYWPTKTPGINGKGTFFDGKTGKIIFLGSKIYPNKDYYLLTKERIYSIRSGITCTEVCQKSINPYNTWHLYKIRAINFSKYTAQFFLKYNVFLTEAPTEVFPVWPPYVAKPYFIYHSESSLYFYMNGLDTEVRIYPWWGLSCEDLKVGKLYKIRSNSKEELLSLGPSGNIDFLYLIKSKLDYKADIPDVNLTDVDGNLIDASVLTKLPKNKIIIIKASYDGKVVVSKNNNIVEKRRLLSNQSTTVDNLAYGYKIEIFQGCDIIRTLTVNRATSKVNYDEIDKEMVRQLRMYKGNEIQIGHIAASIAKELEQLPRTSSWLYHTIRSGFISSNAFNYLITHINKK